MRTYALLVLLAILLVAGPVSPARSGSGDLIGSPVTLKASSTVDSDLIYLGDLFENTGGQADKPVAYAPAPGRQATYSARWLYQIARHFDLEWQPLSIRDAVVIRRDSVVIGRREIEQRLMDTLRNRGVEPGMSVSLANQAIEIHMPTSGSTDFDIIDVVYDSRSGRVSATVEAPANDPSAVRTRVSGSVIHVVEVPVTVRPIGAGETIAANDIEWIEVNAEKIARDTLIAASDVVGMTPRRGLRPGAPIRATEVEAPELVAKNSLVMIVVEQPGMRLTAQGKALEAGAMGDVVRIKNMRSDTVIEAQVSGAGQAVVRPSTLLAMN